MTRAELIRTIISRARAHGFEFQEWYQANIEPEWQSVEQAIEVLDRGRRYYALLFSHEFARHFWKKGTPITFRLPSQEYTRIDKKGKTITVHRRGFTRRTSRSTSNSLWQYHLEQMSLWEEPLRYIRRFILTEDELEAAGGAATPPKKRIGLTRRPLKWL